jgi:hypothetical protein
VEGNGLVVSGDDLRKASEAQGVSLYEMAERLGKTVRLPALQARAAATLGDTSAALAALKAAETARCGSLPDDEIAVLSRMGGSGASPI